MKKKITIDKGEMTSNDPIIKLTSHELHNMWIQMLLVISTCNSDDTDSHRNWKHFWESVEYSTKYVWHDAVCAWYDAVCTLLSYEHFHGLYLKIHLCKRTVLPVVKFPVSHGVTQIPAGHIVSRGNTVISENFCNYHGTWLSPGCNHRNFQKWVIPTELSGHDVSRENLCDTVRHGETLPPAVP